MKTGCDVIAGWAKLERFRRVCPLLQKNEMGAWVYSVHANDVRPFWGRALAYGSATGFIVWVLMVGVIFGGMRAIGYQVTLRQVVWPPAWHELQAVRAALFIDQARINYKSGRVREAIQSLSIAHELNPAHYQVAMMLAQFHQAGNATQSDTLYRKLLISHPEHRGEISRAWFQSLLGRGRMADMAELAKRQLVIEPEQGAAWTYALLFATRHLASDVLLNDVLNAGGVPDGPRAILTMASQIRKLPPESARKLLIEAPLVVGFQFDLVFRIDELIRLGFTQDALTILSARRKELVGRDVARLIFAAYAVQKNRARLIEEYRALLSVDRKIKSAECTLLAVHLVSYPDPDLLKLLVNTLPRLPIEPADAWMEAALAMFCAAGVQGNEELMGTIKK